MCIEGGCADADQLFSSAKVQISRILKKYLPDAPSSAKSASEVQTEQSQVVAAVVAFAQFLCADGTAIEAAERLRVAAADGAAARRAAEAAAREQRRAEKAERRAARERGELDAGDGASDLEDDSADEGGLVREVEDAEANMLGCLSLSKLMKDYVEEYEHDPQGHALRALVSNSYNAYESEEWMQTQVRALLLLSCRLWPQSCRHMAWAAHARCRLAWGRAARRWCGVLIVWLHARCSPRWRLV